MTDVVYEADCNYCEMTTTVKAIRATKWKEEYDGPCGYCGNPLKMKLKEVVPSEISEREGGY